LADFSFAVESRGGRYAAGTGGRKEGRMVAIRQLLLGVHYRNNCGYGDVRPTKRSARVLATVIALVELILAGILVAAAVHAVTIALAAHDAAIKAR
jgi:hypothetical protein